MSKYFIKVSMAFTSFLLIFKINRNMFVLGRVLTCISEINEKHKQLLLKRIYESYSDLRAHWPKVLSVSKYVFQVFQVWEMCVIYADGLKYKQMVEIHSSFSVYPLIFSLDI